jgi:hypothetical protein
MMSVEGEEAQIVAVLHDVIEDTSVTADDLRKAGFSEKLVAAVLCVMHRKDDSYADYVVRCKGNEIARQVKLADLKDNSRLDPLSCGHSGSRPMSPGSASTSSLTSSWPTRSPRSSTGR